MLRSIVTPIFSLPSVNHLIAGLFAVLGLGLLAGPLAQAQTPTPVTSIVNSASDTTLEVNHNGSLFAPGTFINDGTENDSIPATGEGARLMWYPAKAAFRAGRVFDNSADISGVDGSAFWNASNVGSYSMSAGKNTRASGFAATAMGNQTTANGAAATAMGDNTSASADLSTAMGNFTTASGKRATAMGRSTEASGRVSTAMGSSTVASGRIATAMGSRTTASGTGATAMGKETKASTHQATAMGFATLANGSGAVAMGAVTTAATVASLSIGNCNVANTSDDGTLFVAGNGNSSATSCDSRSDALVLDKNGDMTIAGSVTENSDRRLKTEIEPIGEGTLEALADIRPVRFSFKDENTHPSGTQLGVIAQEVQEVFPELVHEGSGGYLSVAYPKLSAVLLKGLQEQQATIEEQEAEIEALKERVERLEDVNERVTALEARSSGSLPAGLSVPGLLLAVLLGGLLGAGLLWRRRG